MGLARRGLPWFWTPAQVGPGRAAHAAGALARLAAVLAAEIQAVVIVTIIVIFVIVVAEQEGRKHLPAARHQAGMSSAAVVFVYPVKGVLGYPWPVFPGGLHSMTEGLRPFENSLA